MGRVKGCTLSFFLLFFTIEGEGGGGQCFFLPSFDMWKEEGKRIFFFLILFFHCEVARYRGSNFGIWCS
jgi:hypothetical protein